MHVWNKMGLKATLLGWRWETKAKWWNKGKRRREHELWEKGREGEQGLQEQGRSPEERRISGRAFWDGGIARDKSGRYGRRYGKEWSAVTRLTPGGKHRLQKWAHGELCPSRATGFSLHAGLNMRDVWLWEVEFQQFSSRVQQKFGGQGKAGVREIIKRKVSDLSTERSRVEGIQVPRFRLRLLLQ